MNKNKIAILTSILGIVGLSVLFGLKASAATSTQSIIIPMYKNTLAKMHRYGKQSINTEAQKFHTRLSTPITDQLIR